MPSKTELVNQALDRVGIASLGNVDTATGDVAEFVRRWYTTVFEGLASRSSLQFLRKRAFLALVNSTTDSEGYYTYQLPTDCLRVVRVVTALAQWFPVDSKQFKASTGTLEVEYISNSALDTPVYWPMPFQMAFIARLAAEVSRTFSPDNNLAQSLYTESEAQLKEALSLDKGQSTMRGYIYTGWFGDTPFKSYSPYPNQHADIPSQPSFEDA